MVFSYRVWSLAEVWPKFPSLCCFFKFMSSYMYLEFSPQKHIFPYVRYIPDDFHLWPVFFQLDFNLHLLFVSKSRRAPIVATFLWNHSEAFLTKKLSMIAQAVASPAGCLNFTYDKARRHTTQWTAPKFIGNFGDKASTLLNAIICW